MAEASYNLHNYNVRPAKSVERKIFTELLKEIYGVSDSNKMTYIGLGSLFFVDFKMIHKELGIKRMINIERNETDRKRFQFNKPFSCIDLEWGDSTEVLNRLDWNGKKIVWLDYDDTLKPYMFEDLDICFSSLKSGSFYHLTCNTSFPMYFDKATGLPKLDQFKNDFEDYVPFNLQPQMLLNQRSLLLREMIVNRIRHNLQQRNSVLAQEDQLEYYQLFNITYKDRAPMFSTGGIILTRKEFKAFKNRNIFSLPYIRTGIDILDIQSPILTNSEIELVNSHLPKLKSRFLSLKKLRFIPEESREMYFNIYRYYPSYVEARDL